MKEKAFWVTLKLMVDVDEYDPPDEWLWPELLDMPIENVEVIRVDETSPL